MVGNVRVRSRGVCGETEFQLEPMSEALVVPPLTWLEIEMSKNATLLVLADRPYEPADYIYDFQEVIKLAKRE